MKQIIQLPIDKYVDEILDGVKDYSTLLVKASPGSGKTTRLPWEIVKKFNFKVAVLEPRRLAAKLAANRIAEEQNLIIGNEVGYHFRFEKNVSPSTKLTFYTEGTFLKKFQSDEIKDFDLIIIDEFHERHLETDIAIALLKDIQQTSKLKIIIMSATLDLKIAESLSDAKTIEIEAPHFPVDLNYLPNVPSVLNQTLEQKVRFAVEETSGDTLVFLPGMREMLKVQNYLKGDFDVFLLHAELSKEEQSRALEPNDRRKIILATNIAESSVTIPGIKVVIDSGIQRSSYFSPWNGLKLIQDSPTTKSSAVQRAGRAGRTGPGVCYRLYSKQDFDERKEFTVPEIETADLTDTYLLLKSIHLNPQWIESPKEEKWLKAKNLLTDLGAIERNELTDLGKKLLAYPLDARLSRILVAGEDLTKPQKEKLLDYICFDLEDDRSGTLKRRLQYYLSKPGTKENWERCVLEGFRDQVALYRKNQKDFIHYSGKIIKSHYSLSDLDGLYLILDITQKQEAIKIFPIEEDWLWDLTPFPFIEETQLIIENQIKLKTKTKIGSIVLQEDEIKSQWNELRNPDKNKIQEEAKKLTQAWLNSDKLQKILYWCQQNNMQLTEQLERINFDNYFNEYGLTFEYLEDFLHSELSNSLDLKKINDQLPDKINLGGRKELTVHYPLNMEPFLEAPIQDFYGQQETPSIMGGKLPLLLKLLGPHKRPIQVTKDLKNFWAKTYQEMKKEYQRDYPRHYWPEDPKTAKPYLLKSHLPKV